jgi:uncharacterized protein YjdB
VKNASFAPNVVKRWFVLFATLALAASCGGMKKANLQTVSVTGQQNLRIGTSVQLVANLAYEGPRGPLPKPTPEWTSSAPTIASVNAAGVATGVGVGTATITASANGKDGVRKGTIVLNVSTERVLTQVTLEPVQKLPVGATLSMVAFGHYSDNTMADLTEQAEWASSDAAVAKVSNGGPSQVKGVLVTLKAGSTEISATIGALVGKTTVTVTDAKVMKVVVQPLAQTIAKGVTFDFKANALLDDNSTLDVTKMAAWDSSLPAVATIDANGRATGIGMGVSDITATYLSVKSAAAKLTVTGVPPKSLAVTPPAPTLPKGATVQLEADATFPDNTTQKVTNSATWISSDTAVATVDAAGKVTAIAKGPAKITATFGTVSAFASVTVTDAMVVSIAVTPATQTVPIGLNQTYVATATYSDMTQRTVTDEVVWATTDGTIASISNLTGTKGVLSAIKVGSTMVTAALDGKMGSASVTVNDAVINALAVSPANFSAPIGLRVAYTARGLFTDGTNRDVTGLVTWSSSAPAVAEISNAAGSQGYAIGATAGTTTIKAILSGVMQSVTLTVRNVALASINIDPFTATIAKTTSIRLTSTAIYADNTDYDITDQSDWSSSATAVATVSTTAGSRGQVTGVAAGSATITAAFGGMAKGAVVAVTNAVLVSLSVSPTNRTLPRGVFFDYHAAGVFDDNTNQDLTDQVVWSATPTTSATISNASPTRGRVTTTQTPGTAVIKATLGAVSAMTNLTVSAADLTALAVVPPTLQIAKLSSGQLTVSGHYVLPAMGTMPADSFDFDLTNQAFWQSSNNAVATVSIAVGSEGVVTGVTAGTATISATFGGKTGNSIVTVTNATISGITVLPNTALISFLTKQRFTATASFSDTTTQPITAFATWTSSDPTKAVISNNGADKGEATGVDAGTVTIRANYLGAMGTATLTVTSSPLASISVTPAGRTIATTTTQQYVATGTFDDMTTQPITNIVTWSATNVDPLVVGPVATISNNDADRGLATAGSTGVSTIKAALGTKSGTTTLTVTPATLVSIAVSPATRAPLPIGLTQQYTVQGTYSDGSSQNLTSSASWSLQNGMLSDGKVTISTSGLATAVAVGTSTITATVNGKTSSATLTVGTATLVSITIPLGNPSLAAGITANYTATGHYTDGNTADVTAMATWTSSAPTVVQLTDTGTATVHARGLIPGVSTITASITPAGGGTPITGTSTMTVTNATLSSVAVTPFGPTNMPKGTQLQLTVTGTFSDGNHADLTEDPTTVWSVMTGNGNATVSSVMGSKGLVSATIGALAAGGAETIVATVTPVGGVARSNSATVVVTAAVLRTLTLTRVGSNPLPLGLQATYSAVGTYTDNTVDTHLPVTWSSSNTATATIAPGALDSGVVTTLAQGTTTIKAVATATPTNFEATEVLTVGPGVVVSIAITSTDLTGSANSMAIGTQAQMFATAHYSDPAIADQDVTNQATWTVDAPHAANASVSSTGVVDAVSASAGIVLSAAFGGQTGTYALTVTNATISTIALTLNPGATTVNGGTTTQFTAIGTFSNGNSQALDRQVTWNSSNSAAATISNAAGTRGLMTSLQAQTVRMTTISANWNGVGGSTVMTVNAATLMSIEVTARNGQTAIPVGVTVPFTATGIYSDQSTSDLTATVAWSIIGSVMPEASVTNATPKGNVKGLIVGNAVVNANLGGMGGTNGTLAITVITATVGAVAVSGPIVMGVPVTTAPIGIGQQFTASATINGVAGNDVTASVTWGSSNPAVATVSPTGLVTGVSSTMGTTDITAVYQGTVSAPVTFTVTNATYTSLELTPAAASTPKGLTVPFIVVARFSDGSGTNVTAAGGTAYMADNGVNVVAGAADTSGYSGALGGTSTITATYMGKTSNAATLTVTPAVLQSITVTFPAPGGGAAGYKPPATVQFVATGNYTDGPHVMTDDVLWTSSAGAVATISNAAPKGLATPKVVGVLSTSTISAIDPVTGITGTATFTVIP